MSEPVNLPTTPAQPSPVSEPVKGRCFKCSTPITVAFPNVIAFEGVIVSTVVISHERGIECPNCGTYHNLIISPSKINFQLVPLPKPQLNEIDPPKIVPVSPREISRLKLT